MFELWDDNDDWIIDIVREQYVKEGIFKHGVCFEDYWINLVSNHVAVEIIMVN